MPTVEKGWAASITRRRAIKAGMALGAFAAGSGMRLFAPESALADTAKIVVQYDWLVSNGQFGDIVAVHNGYFHEQGLDVEISPGGPNATTLAPVASGQAVLGQFSGASQVLLARAAGAPVVLFATGYQRGPFAYFSLPKAPVRKPEDLIGKRVGVQPTARSSLDALMAKAKIDPSGLEISTIGFDMTPLVTGQVDVVTGWVTNTQALSVIGPDRVTMLEASAGVNDPGEVYFATESALDGKADLLARFLRAVGKGWAFTHDNPAEAVEIAVKAYPNLDLAVEKQTIAMVLGLSFDQNTLKTGWGSFEPSAVTDQIDVMDEIGMFNGATKPVTSEVATTKILEMTAADRPRYG